MQTLRQMDGGWASKRWHPAINAGHDVACVSSVQPGISLKVLSRNTAFAGCAGVADAVTGGTVVVAVGVGGGAVTQPVTAAISAVANARWRIAMMWLLLEALVALSLAVFIVWFTMGARRTGDKPRQPHAPDTEASAPDAKVGKD